MGYLNIKEFKDIHKNEPVALLCNGPTLNDHDFSTIPIRTVGMHGSWRNIQSEYHVILIHKPYFEEIKAGLCKPKIVFVRDFYGEYITIPGYYEKKPRKWHPYQYHKDTVIVPRMPGKQNTSFSFDLNEGNNTVHCGLFALEVVVWMGFNPIYVLGLDLIAGTGHSYDVENYKSPPQDRRDIQVNLWNKAAKRIEHCKPRVKVYNVNRKSAVTEFEYRSPWDDYKS